MQASTGALLKGQDISKRPWFSNALRGQNLGDVHEALLLSRLLVNPDQEPQRFVDIAFALDESDQLRTPMTAIYASLSLLESGMAGELPTDVHKLVEISSKSCERLIRLINDVLDIEKIQSGMMQYEKQHLPLQALVEQAVRDTLPFAAEYGVQFEFAARANPTVLADADRIVQVTVNLLSNAAKFSPRGGVVEIRLELRDGMARVGVRDSGAGVPDAFRERVFERFAQADGSDRRQMGGSGLGLNICRGIIQAHHGRIAFTSEPGRTEFFFELPLA